MYREWIQFDGWWKLGTNLNSQQINTPLYAGIWEYQGLPDGGRSVFPHVSKTYTDCAWLGELLVIVLIMKWRQSRWCILGTRKNLTHPIPAGFITGKSTRRWWWLVYKSGRKNMYKINSNTQ